MLFVGKMVLTLDFYSSLVLECRKLLGKWCERFPRVFIFYYLKCQVFADARMWEMALGMKQKMLEAGVTPNAVTWSSLISACAKAGLVDEAFVLFEEMMVSNCMPNSQCFNVLLYACVKAFQYDRAFRLFESWKKNEYGNITNRQNLSQGSLEVSMKVPFRPTTSTYNVLIKACGTDDFRARGLMDEMRTAGIFPNHITWSTLIGVYGGSGDVKRAVQVRQNSSNYIILLLALITFANSVQILKTMRNSGVQPDVVAFTAAIKVCVKQRELNLAFSLFAEMQKYQVQPNMVRNMI